MVLVVLLLVLVLVLVLMLVLVVVVFFVFATRKLNIIVSGLVSSWIWITIALFVFNTCQVMTYAASRGLLSGRAWLLLTAARDPSCHVSAATCGR